ncbi:hypothetical protein L6164_032696 [Bauhinia variegata]|uniref:Uncharacterized protein n=1 Tax=Bauhinia variegata TaxID=167791 RepID=A0ACB9KPI0_BAUVA|nr:hypothetical protein L6164_032696 [Bauhinia variegata]
MEDHTYVVGQEFPDVKAFRNAIKEAAIAQHFELRIIKSDLVRYFAKCASEGCPWRIRAVKVPNAPTFTIRSLEETHTCGRNAHNGHHQASVDWIIKKSNPGSIAEVFTTGADNRFQRLFVSFYASIYGFLNGCLLIVGVGGIQLKSKYLGTLLSSTSVDADGGLFPLAFGVVDAENEESWTWFMSELHKALEMNTENIPPIIVFSDGQKGIMDAVRRKFPNSSHAYCMRHLSESIGKEFKNSRLVHLLWKAAYATTTVAFKEKMAEIEEVSPEAAKWLQQFHPSNWALVYFDGTRYGHLSSNVEEFNKWILEARELPIIQVIDWIHRELQTEFKERRSRSSSWLSVLAPSAEKRMMEAINRASSYQVLRSDEVKFEVLSAERSDIVNIGSRSCSCRDWQLHGIPCSHAVAALISCRKDVYAFTEKCFTVNCYRETYAEEIHPIPGKLEWRKTDEAAMDEDVQAVRPPKFRRPPGRPEKKRICVEDLNHEKHTVHCSRCNQTGHYKTTCKAEIIGTIEQF